MALNVVYRKKGQAKGEFTVASLPEDYNPVQQLMALRGMFNGKKVDAYMTKTNTPEQAIQEAKDNGFNPKKLAPK